jgi:PAS domain S-box-containing protein
MASGVRVSDDVRVLEERIADLERLLELQERVARDHARVRAKAHQRLIQSEASFRALFERSPVPMLVFEPDSQRVIEANLTALALYGRTREELLGLRLPDLAAPDDEFTTAQREVARANAEAGRSWRGTRRHRRRDGSVIEVDITSLSLVHDGRAVRIVALVDVTEPRRLEAQLRQAQKMDAVGQLAGGIAHDFNNLLSVILSYTKILLEEHPPADSLRADLDEIRQAGERAASLTRQLLAFSRKQILAPSIADLNDLLGGMESMLRRLVGETIALTFTPAPSLGKVFVDRGQIEQVVLNLVVNARDASGTSGRVALETKNVELDAAYAAENPGVTPGPYVRFSVADEGRGMAPATIARIFEPFFTTKEKDKGTGLGLSMVFGIVEQSGGHIRVVSQPGRGSTFHVYFPRTDSPPLASEAPSSTIAPSPPSGRRSLSGALGSAGTILLVEDDEAVRRTVRRILKRRGYNVLEAQNGGEAFLLCERHEGPIDLLLTDVVMPLMNGREVANRLARMRPDMRVLYMSGYTEHSIVQGGTLEPGLAFLPKPVTPEGLAQKVREVLTRPR